MNFTENEELVFEETHKFISQVDCTSAASLTAAMTKHSVTSKAGKIYEYKVGFVLRDNEFYSPYLKLLNPDKYDSLVPVQWTLWLGVSTDWVLQSRHQLGNGTLDHALSAATIPTKKWHSINPDADSDFGNLWRHELTFRVRDTSATTQVVADFKKASIANATKHLDTLFADSKSADVKVVCGDGVELHAHRWILSGCASPVVAAMINADMTEGRSGLVKVDDIKSATMKVLLKYLYTGKLAEEDWRKPETIVEFTYAAGKYQLEDVLKLLDHILGTVDHGENNFALLVLADKLGLQNAGKVLFKRVKNSINKVENCSDLLRILQL